MQLYICTDAAQVWRFGVWRYFFVVGVGGLAVTDGDLGVYDSPQDLTCSAFPRETAKSPAGCCDIQIRISGLEKGLRALDTNRLELVGVETEQLQNGWGDLRRLYRRCDIQAASRSGPYH